MTKRGDNELTTRHCLLTRALMLRPEFDPTPVPPTGKELLDIIRDIDPAFSEARLPTLLGLEPSAKDRLLDPGFSNTPTVNHYMLLIRNALVSAPSVREKQERLQFFKDIVEMEAKARKLNLDKLWRRGGWREFGSAEEETVEARK